ncbi:MAG: transposase, partial [Aeromicrobium sp.]
MLEARHPIGALANLTNQPGHVLSSQIKIPVRKSAHQKAAQSPPSPSNDNRWWIPISWTAPVDIQRITPHQDTTDATIDQVRRLVKMLDDGDVPMFVFDAGYDPVAIGYGLGDTPAPVLCRIRDDRVFYTDPPPRPNRPPGTGGRPPRHGQ